MVERHRDGHRRRIFRDRRNVEDDPVLLYGRAMLHERSNRIDAALADLRRIIDENPADAQALNAYGYTLADRGGRYAEALPYLERAYALAPDSAPVIDSLGWVSYRLGREARALELLQQAWARLKDAEIAAHLGEVLWTAGRQDEARTVWNAMVDRRPAVIVRCTTAGDVQECVRFAAREGLLLTVKGGGHNIAGNAVADDALTIDCSPMRRVIVDVHTRRARVEPGRTTRWHCLRGTGERYVILEGAGRVEIGDLPPQAVGAGDVVVIPPETRQRIANTGDGDLVFLAICSGGCGAGGCGGSGGTSSPRGGCAGDPSTRSGVLPRENGVGVSGFGGRSGDCARRSRSDGAARGPLGTPVHSGRGGQVPPFTAPPWLESPPRRRDNRGRSPCRTMPSCRSARRWRTSSSACSCCARGSASP